MPNEVENTEVVEKEQVDTQQEATEKKVTIEEMNRRIAKEKAKYEADKTEAIQKAIEKYKAETELRGKELEDYRKKESEKEKQDLLDKIASLEKEQTKRELTEEAIKSLSNRKLPVNDKVLGFVVKDNADDTLQAIADFESIISEIKAEYSKSEPPKVSSGLGEDSTSRAEHFRKARII